MRGKKEQLYFEVGGEQCWSLSFFQERIENGEDKIILQIAKPCKSGEEYHWCKEEDELLGQGEGNCGKNNCTHYKPRNGKNGCCIHLIRCYEPVGEELILTKDGIELPTKEKGK